MHNTMIITQVRSGSPTTLAINSNNLKEIITANIKFSGILEEGSKTTISIVFESDQDCDTYQNQIPEPDATALATAISLNETNGVTTSISYSETESMPIPDNLLLSLRQSIIDSGLDPDFDPSLSLSLLQNPIQE